MRYLGMCAMLLLGVAAPGAPAFADPIAAKTVTIGYRIYVDDQMVASPMLSVSPNRTATATVNGKWKVEMIASPPAGERVDVKASLWMHQRDGWIQIVTLQSILTGAMIGRAESKSGDSAFRLDMSLDGRFGRAPGLASAR